MMSVNPNALRLYNDGISKNRKANNYLVFGSLFTAGGIVMLGCTELYSGYYIIGSAAYNRAVAGVLSLLIVGSTSLTLGTGLLIPGIVIKVVEKNQIRNAVNMYNYGLSTAQAELKINFTGNGLGMALIF